VEDGERVQACSNVVHHNSNAFRKAFEAAERKRLGDVEKAKEQEPAV
jgi:uncharacterized protein (DUF927 family)